MAFTTAQLIGYLSLVDRPHHAEVLALVKRAMLLPKLIRPLAATILAYLLLAYVADMGSEAIPIAAAVGAVMFVTSFLNDTVMLWAERNSPRIAMVLSVVGLFSGLAFTLHLKKEPLFILAAGAGGFCLTWIVVTLGLALLSLLMILLSSLLIAFSSPLAVPALVILAKINNYIFRKKYKDWVTSRGEPMIEFGSEGVKHFQHGNEAIFVASPRLRCDGTAMAVGIPLFTINELENGSFVEQRISAAYEALNTNVSEGHGDIVNHSFMEFNPANGLPMLAGIGSVDVMGNAFGTDSNQSYSSMDMGYDGFNDSFNDSFNNH